MTITGLRTQHNERMLHLHCFIESDSLEGMKKKWCFAMQGNEDYCKYSSTELQ